MRADLTNEILDEVFEERKYQCDTYGAEFDDKNTANDWVTYITRYAANAGSDTFDREEYEKALIKVAALAVAAIESSRRETGPAKRHYDA